MKGDKIIGKVFSTDNLEQFKTIVTNRELRGRVEKVKKSIEQYGWINSPIVCNEKLEVIDGQARLAACKELGCGLTYTVISGLNIDDCRVLNSCTTNWTYIDFIKSYAENGNTNYVYIWQTVRKIRNEWGTDSLKVLNQILGASNTQNLIKAGEAKMTAEQADEASRHISFVTPFIPLLKQHKYNGTALIDAIYYASRKMPEYARERLLDAFQKRASYELIGSVPSRTMDCIELIDRIYNYNRQKAYRFSLKRIYEDEGSLYAN